MAVKIRLKRIGSKKNAHYRVVVADSRRARDGRFIEELGYYDPNTDPGTIKIDTEKAQEWLTNGAQPTETVRALLKREGLLGGTKAEATDKPADEVKETVAEEVAPEAAAVEELVEEAVVEETEAEAPVAEAEAEDDAVTEEADA